MATVNFSVPDEVKDAFNAAFKGRNKSAVIAELMIKAVEDARIQRRRQQAVRDILARRSQRKPVTDADIRRIRKALRTWP
jgi:hypothetical protein